jgi:hypothetical protein
MQNPIDLDALAERYKMTCERASARSREFACTVHVYAIVTDINGLPLVTGYGISDWYDGSTVRTYVDGRSTN